MPHGLTKRLNKTVNKMTELDITTEAQIIQAARKVFLVKGFEGARMQEIADEAGINKALLHYYFRSKEKLFQSIFQEAFQRFIPSLYDVMLSERTLPEKLDLIIDRYQELLFENPYLPQFILQEVNRNPECLKTMFQKFGVQPSTFISFLEKEMTKEGITHITPQHLLVNILSLNIFPFAAKPILSIILFNNNKDEYLEFMKERKEYIKLFIHNALFKS